MIPEKLSTILVAATTSNARRCESGPWGPTPTRGSSALVHSPAPLAPSHKEASIRAQENGVTASATIPWDVVTGCVLVCWHLCWFQATLCKLSDTANKLSPIIFLPGLSHLCRTLLGFPSFPGMFPNPVPSLFSAYPCESW